MSAYHAPLKDMLFVMKELAGLEQVGKLPGYEDATVDTVTAILEEAAKFATEVLDPLNVVGDREGSKLMDGGIVKTPTGFKEAMKLLGTALDLRHAKPKIVKSGPCKEVVHRFGPFWFAGKPRCRS